MAAQSAGDDDDWSRPHFTDAQSVTWNVVFLVGGALVAALVPDERFRRMGLIGVGFGVVMLLVGQAGRWQAGRREAALAGEPARPGTYVWQKYLYVLFLVLGIVGLLWIAPDNVVAV